LYTWVFEELRNILFMKANLIRFISFILIFILIFLCLQEIYLPYSNVSNLIAQFYNEPVNSIDVLMFGTSSVRAAVHPPVLWDEAGIASFNFAAPRLNPAISYFLLRETLDYQSPSVVILGGQYLFSESVDFHRHESGFRRGLDRMRLSRNKLAAINKIVSNDERQTRLSYLLPLLRYHDRKDLSKSDFDFAFLWERSLWMSALNPSMDRSAPVVRPEFTASAGDISGYYVQRKIELLKERNIDVVLIFPPVCHANYWSEERHNTLQNFADSMGVLLIDFNTEELYNYINLDESIDFYNKGHVNLSGGTKTARYIAQYLSQTFNLPDRRDGQFDPHWDLVLEVYHTRYRNLLEKIAEGQFDEVENEEEM